MCGIVGGIGQRPMSQVLLAGLSKLEYRGYDSAGMALVCDQTVGVQRYRVEGRVNALATTLGSEEPAASLGIAHTRWATHGVPAERNAHPHVSSDKLAIVHNGIIENHHSLTAELTAAGYEFSSETDSEVIAHLVHHYYTGDVLAALQQAVTRLAGAYAIGCVHADHPGELYAARHGSPLVVGVGIGENFIASDPLALLPVTQQFIYLQDGDCTRLSQDALTVFDVDGSAVVREVKETALTASQAVKGEYRHFMLKEIHEQPQVIRDTLSSVMINGQAHCQAFGPQAETILREVKRVHMIACGTSLHAAAVAQHWFERYAGLPCQIDIASEHRYRQRVVEPDTLFVALSQSGETADTLAALRQAKQVGYVATLGICNVPESALAREADMVFLTRAGAEIGVAATKTFTAQLVALAALMLSMAPWHGADSNELNALLSALQQLPEQVATALTFEPDVMRLAEQFIEKQHALFLGRGEHFAIAQEGALKLKEISYLHAEAYAAGELKHGPLALIDEDMPVVVVAPSNEVIDKLISNMQEVQARGGELIVFTDNAIDSMSADSLQQVRLPAVHDFISPIVFNIPLQLLAYHVAVLKGTDVDQPRNLAKSVTVE